MINKTSLYTADGKSGMSLSGVDDNSRMFYNYTGIDENIGYMHGHGGVSNVPPHSNHPKSASFSNKTKPKAKGARAQLPMSFSNLIP